MVGGIQQLPQGFAGSFPGAPTEGDGKHAVATDAEIIQPPPDLEHSGSDQREVLIPEENDEFIAAPPKCFVLLTDR